MDKAYLQTAQKQFRDELLESVVPFWQKHSLDREQGGYFSCLTRDGTVYDTDKFAWMQGREIWMFAKLCEVYGPREEWLAAAKHGVDFMRAHAFAENGDVYFSFDRAGNPLVAPYNIYSDCFLCIGLAQYGKMAGDDAAIEEALRLYKRIQARQQNPKGPWSKPVPGARDLCAMSFVMIQLSMARELEGLFPDELVGPIVEENLQTFFDRHVDRERKTVFERTLPNGGHMFEVMEGRLLCPGHALETLWFIMDIAAKRGYDAMVRDAAEITLWCLESGWDKEYGGLYYYQDYMGYPPDKLESNMKLWWANAEAMNAALLGWKLTGSDAHYQWFETLRKYCFAHFSDREGGGEWFGYLERDGRPAFTNKGGKWKGFFHLPRTLMECEQWLGEMATGAGG